MKNINSIFVEMGNPDLVTGLLFDPVVKTLSF